MSNSLAEILEQKEKSPHTPLKEKNNTIDNSQLLINLKNNRQLVSSKAVDILLEDCVDLVDPNYFKWFAKCFYRLNGSRIRALAAAAREGRQPQRLFTWLIKRDLGM